MTTDSSNYTKSSPFYKAAWRWHFYAGLFVSPFLIILALTGLVMMYIGYFDGRDGENISVSVPINGQMLSLKEQSSSVLASHPTGKIVEFLNSPAANKVNVFRVNLEDKSQIMVAINPYDAQIVESWQRRTGWYDLADNIHGDLLLGTTGDRILEIAAGFAIVLLITGLYMWWPRGKGFHLPIIPKLSLNPKQFYKDLHTLFGVYGSVFILMFLLSGMSWTGIWGTKMMQAWSTFPAEKWDNVPLSKQTHASLNHNGIKDMPWAIEQTPLPASTDPHAHHKVDKDTPLATEQTKLVTDIDTGQRIHQSVDLDFIHNLATRLDFTERFRIAYPSGVEGVWTLNQDTMSSDASDPFSDKTVHVDRYSGKILAQVNFADYSLAGKTMAVTIPLHMGLFTVFNLIFNTFLCIGIIIMSVSGFVIWWKRRPSNAGIRLCPPSTPNQLPHWNKAMLIMLFLSMFFPLVGITLICVLLLDILIISKIAPLKRIFA